MLHLSTNRTTSNLLKVRKQWFCPSLSSSSSAAAAAATVASSTTNPPVSIPMKKHRDELSVLRALSSTVHNSFAMPYFIIDTPFTTPEKRSDLKVFSLARASGIETAKYILSTMPDVVANMSNEVPLIKPLFPIPSIENLIKAATEANCCEEEKLKILNILIELNKASEAYEVYLTMAHPINESAVLSLLELLSATNGGENVINSLIPNEIFFNYPHHERCGIFNLPSDSSYWISSGTKQEKFTLPINKNTHWTLDNNAEKLFSTLSTTTTNNDTLVAAYTSIIRGAARFGNVKRAFEMSDLLLKQYPNQLDLSTCKLLLSCLATIRMEKFTSVGGGETKTHWEKALEIVNYIQLQTKFPIDESLFELLFRILRFTNDLTRDEKEENCLKLLNEMKFLQIKPSLGCLDHLLNFLYSSDDAEGEFGENDMKSIYGHDVSARILFEKILKMVKETDNDQRNKFLTAFDFDFFSTAMVVASKKLNRWNYCEEIYKISQNGANQRFVRQMMLTDFIDFAAKYAEVEKLTRFYFDLLSSGAILPKSFLIRQICRRIEEAIIGDSRSDGAAVSSWSSFGNKVDVEKNQKKKEEKLLILLRLFDSCLVHFRTADLQICLQTVLNCLKNIETILVIQKEIQNVDETKPKSFYEEFLMQSIACMRRYQQIHESFSFNFLANSTAATTPGGTGNSNFRNAKNENLIKKTDLNLILEILFLLKDELHLMYWIKYGFENKIIQISLVLQALQKVDDVLIKIKMLELIYLALRSKQLVANQEQKKEISKIAKNCIDAKVLPEQDVITLENLISIC